MDSLIIYSPSSDMIGELVPLYTKQTEEQDIDLIPNYKISISAFSAEPAAYVLFVDDKDGTLINADMVKSKLKDRTIVEL